MSDTLDVRLMGREYRVACTEEERAQLLDAVDYLDARMRELAERTGGSGERLAVMTALNIAHELLQMRGAVGFDASAMKRKMHSMQSRIDEALAQQDKLF